MIPTVVCVLRSGGEYTAEHVHALYVGIKTQWPNKEPLRFVVLTDLDDVYSPGFEVRPLRESWKGWWAKMEMFSAEHDDLGDILYVDLDTIIVGSLGQLIAVNQLTLLQDFYHPEKVSAGLMYLPKYDRPAVWAGWLEEKDVMQRLNGDSDYLDIIWRTKALRWQTVFPEQVLSYKVHIRQRKGLTIPPNARVICFHGRPRPWTTPLWEPV